MTRFIVAPQWQGSSSARAMLLIDGAEAIAGDLPRASTTRVDVPLEAGEALGTGILRFSTLVTIRERVSEALAAVQGEVPLVIGGDAAVAVPGIAHALASHPDLAVIWCSARGALHSPASSPTGAFESMALRHAVGVGETPLIVEGLAPERVMLVGVRDLDDAEAGVASSSGIPIIGVDDLADADAVARAVRTSGASHLYIHIDLDVLDPAVISGVTSPVPFGLDVAALTALVAALRAQTPLVGASLSGFAPQTPAAAIEDLGAILRLIGSLA